MALKFKVGDAVKQNAKPIEGVVTRAHIVDGDSVEFFVAYTGSDGEKHERSFTEDQIVAASA